MASSRFSWNRRHFPGTTIAGGAALALGPRLARAQAIGANDSVRIVVPGNAATGQIERA
jgi:hypothetical protein